MLVKLINSWAQGIIVAVIIATIIEIILPEGNNKKYVKVILGVYILFTIAYPVINVISNHSISFNSIITSTNSKMEKYEANTITIETNAYIETTYKNNLKEDVTNNLKEKGYKVLNLNINIETKDQERYGQINSIVMNIELLNKEEQRALSSINEININLSNTNNVDQSIPISEDEINTLKQYFENTYSIEKSRIHINE